MAAVSVFFAASVTCGRSNRIPRAFGFRRGETEYWIAVFPLGGYVKKAGDVGDEADAVPPEDRGRGFLEQSPWRRLAISVAGPAANLVFPAVVYFALRRPDLAEKFSAYLSSIGIPEKSNA